MSSSRKENVSASIHNQQADLAVGAADLVDISFIFSMFLKDVLHNLLEHSLKFIMFPFAALANLVRAGLSWRQAYLDRNNSLFLKAIVDTLGALAITTAVVGSLAFTATFTLIAPIIFTATLGVKSLFHAGLAIYHTVNYLKDKDEQHKQHAIGNSVAAITNALLSITVGFVMIAKMPIVAVLGVATGLAGAAFAIYKVCSLIASHRKNLRETNPVDLEKNEEKKDKNDDEFSQQASLFKQLGVNKNPEKSSFETLHEAFKPKAVTLGQPNVNLSLFILPGEYKGESQDRKIDKPIIKNTQKLELRKTF